MNGFSELEKHCVPKLPQPLLLLVAQAFKPCLSTPTSTWISCSSSRPHSVPSASSVGVWVFLWYSFEAAFTYSRIHICLPHGGMRPFQFHTALHFCTGGQSYTRLGTSALATGAQTGAFKVRHHWLLSIFRGCDLQSFEMWAHVASGIRFGKLLVGGLRFLVPRPGLDAFRVLHASLLISGRIRLRLLTSVGEVGLS